MSGSLTLPEAAVQQHLVHSLPVIVLHVHSRCNCRCVMCDIWQTKDTQELSRERLFAMMPSFESLGVQWVVLTGGEPLLHRDLAGICGPLRQAGIRVTLLTTGLLLARHASVAADLFDEIIVSIDGPAEIHDAIRRVERGLARIEEGLQLVRSHAPNLPLRARTTVQKANRQHLRATVSVAQQLPLDSISFLAADLTSEAFNRKLLWPVARQNEIGLSLEEVSDLQEEVEALIAECKPEIASGFVVESPYKLRRIVEHFQAHLGLAMPRAPLCNAPWTSAIVELDGAVRPCFFHPAVGNIEHTSLQAVANGNTAVEFRSQLNVASNPICQRCVCSLNYRQG